MTSYGPVTAAGDVNLAELETSRSSLGVRLGKRGMISECSRME